MKNEKSQKYLEISAKINKKQWLSVNQKEVVLRKQKSYKHLPLLYAQVRLPPLPLSLHLACSILLINRFLLFKKMNFETIGLE